MTVYQYVAEGKHHHKKIDGVTFYIGSPPLTFDRHNSQNRVLGVGVNDVTKQITHIVDFDYHGSPDAIGVMPGRGATIFADELNAPIDLEDFTIVANISHDLRAVLLKLSKGLDAGAEIIGKSASK